MRSITTGRWVRPLVAAALSLNLAVMALPTDAGAVVRHFTGLYGGDVSTVAFSPDGAVVLAGTRQGLFRSVDAGQTWHPTLGLERWFVQDVEFHPSDSSIVFAVAGQKLSRSNDGGLTWTVTGPRSDPAAEDVAISASDPDRMLLAAYGKAFSSSDGGDTWQAVFSQADVEAERLYISSAAIAPADDSVLLLCAQRSIDGHAYNELHRSTDAGATWSTVSDYGNCGDLMWDPANPQHLWGADAMELRRSTDAGATWQVVNSIRGAATAVRFSPDGERLYVFVNYSNTSLTVSTDDGASWRDAWAPRDSSVLAVSPAGQDVMLVGTTGGVYRSVDGGRSYTKSNTGLTAQPALSVATRPVDSGTIFVNLGSSGLFRSRDAGVTWTDLAPDGTRAWSLVVDAGNTLYAGTGSSVARSTDDGDSWTSAPLPDETYAGKLIAHAAKPGVLLTGGTSPGDNSPLLRSSDGGDTWAPVGPKGFQVVDMARQATSETVYALIWSPPADDHRLYRTDDFGDTWSRVRVPAPDTWTAIASGPTPGEIYIGDDTVYRSHDGGVSWTAAADPAPWAITALAVDPLDPQQVIAGTQNRGMWLSTDRGANWRRSPSAQDGESVETIAFAPAARPSDPTDLPGRPALVGAARWSSSGLLKMTPAPHARRQPIVEGTPRVGRTLRCNVGRWSRAQRYEYRWFRDGERLTATGAHRTVRRSDLGHQLRCKVIARGWGGTGRARSAAVRVRS